ncbi:MAG: LuxR C-terminal-related transcriptional regulator [Paludibacter sp.]
MISGFRVYIFPLICLCFFGCSLIPGELKTAEELMETSPDSALKVLRGIRRIQLINPADKALYALLMSQAYDKNDIKIESDSLISIAADYYDKKEPIRAGYAWLYSGRCAHNRGNAEAQADALLKAQEFAEMTDNYKLQGLVYCDKADMYQSQNQMDSVIAYNKKGYQVFVKANDTYNSVLAAISIGYSYSAARIPDSALAYYSTAEKLTVPLNDIVLTSTIYKGLGNNAFHQKDYQKALYYYHKAPVTNCEIYDYNKWYLIGKTFVKINRLDSAKYYLNKVKHLDIMTTDYYLLWQKIYEKEQNLPKSLYYAKKIITIKDSIYKHSLKNSFAGLEKKYHYEHLSVENKNLIIKNKQKGIMILVFLLLTSIIVIVFLNWRFQTKKHQLTIQQQLNEQEKALLEKANENNDLLQRQTRMQYVLLQNVEQYRSESSKGKRNILDKTRSSVSKIEEEIIIHTDSIYKNISNRLSEKYPQLTQRDILICCMLLAGFDTGMIATILDVRYESINIHRSRLRKKLQLENNENLIEFLRNF